MGMWDWSGETDASRGAATKAIAATITTLMSGQYVLFESPNLEEGDAATTSCRVAVTHYGHGLYLVEVPGNAVADVMHLTQMHVQQLRDMGFVEPSGSLELVGHPETWQFAFPARAALIGAETLVWVQEILFNLPHSLLMSRVTGGTLIEGDPEPCLHTLQHHSTVI